MSLSILAKALSMARSLLLTNPTLREINSGFGLKLRLR